MNCASLHLHYMYPWFILFLANHGLSCVLSFIMIFVISLVMITFFAEWKYTSKNW